jgi:phage replication-related protein YjqB (UPF0714/DUF867 family)
MTDDRYQPYTSFGQLVRYEREGVDYSRRFVQRASPVLIAAPHGGGIEPGTSEVASALAGEAHSLYMFEGFKGEQNQRLHVSSTRFNDPLLDDLLGQSEFVASIHGCRETKPVVYVGGLHENWVQQSINLLRQAGFFAEWDTSRHAGRFPTNLCNRGRKGMGVQFELSRGLRRQMFASLTHRGRQFPTTTLQRFTDALQPLWDTQAARHFRSAW